MNIRERISSLQRQRFYQNEEVKRRARQAEEQLMLKAERQLPRVESTMKGLIVELAIAGVLYPFAEASGEEFDSTRRTVLDDHQKGPSLNHTKPHEEGLFVGKPIFDAQGEWDNQLRIVARRRKRDIVQTASIQYHTSGRLLLGGERVNLVVDDLPFANIPQEYIEERIIESFLNPLLEKQPRFKIPNLNHNVIYPKAQT